MLGAGRVDLPPTGQKMMVDQTDDVEAIGHDLSFRKVLADQGAVSAGQIHANHSHPLLARQLRQICLQSSLTAAQHDIEDAVSAQIAERGGISVLLRKEML